MKKNKTPESQIRANRRWEENNRDHVRKKNYLRSARLFVRSYADDEDIEDLIRIYTKENANASEKIKEKLIWKELLAENYTILIPPK